MRAVKNEAKKTGMTELPDMEGHSCWIKQRKQVFSKAYHVHGKLLGAFTMLPYLNFIVISWEYFNNNMPYFHKHESGSSEMLCVSKFSKLEKSQCLNLPLSIQGQKD